MREICSVHLSLALVQLPAITNDPAANLERGVAACREAARRDAHIVLFPELWQTGFAMPIDPTHAIRVDDPWIDAFRSLASELSLAIVPTFLESHSSGTRNAAVVIDRRGEIVLRYAKVHTCDFAAEAVLASGVEFPVAELDTAGGRVKIGVMICFDREFPESARTLMLNGAELILTPNACELNDERLGQFRARAFENMTAVAMANYPSPLFNGGSCAYDGMAFRADESPRDHLIATGTSEPEIVMATIDVGALREYRSREVWGAKYRKPDAYRSHSEK